ncbi:MAG: autotransporter outer membrane beta-barrel domain-containing protein [Bacilli bacterium]
MDWRRFLCHPDQRESGATLLGVIGIAVVLSLLTASILSFALQSTQAVRFSIDHTQALYNARMGVDAAVELIRAEVTSTTMTSANGGTSLADAVNPSLSQISGRPFAAQVSVVPQTSPPSRNTLVMAIASTGTAGQASVLLTVEATLTASSGSGGGTTGTASKVQIPNFPRSISKVTVSNTNSASVQISGSGQGSVVVNGASTSVTGFPNLQTLSGNGSIQNHPVNGNLWISGTNDTVTSAINGTAIVTGDGATLQRPVNGTAIVTGSGETLDGNVNGPLLLFGSGSTVNGSTDCGAIITGNDTTISANVNGALIITGNNTTISGNINQELVVTGNNLTVHGTINGKFIATGTGEVVNGTVNQGISEYKNNVTVNGRVNGQITQFNGKPIVVNTPCMGAVTLKFAAPSSGTPTVSLNFSSAAISG